MEPTFRLWAFATTFNDIDPTKGFQTTNLVEIPTFSYYCSF